MYCTLVKQGIYLVYLESSSITNCLWAVIDIETDETNDGFCPVVPQHTWWWRRTVECNGLLVAALGSREVLCSDVVSPKLSLSEAAGRKIQIQLKSKRYGTVSYRDGGLGG
jgi:hypothetical protein